MDTPRVPYTRITLLSIAILVVIGNQIYLSRFTVDIAPIPLSFVKPNVTLLLMVTSYAGDYTRRNVLRETYLSFADERFTWFFIVGKGNVTQELKQEQEIYKDIFILDCHDGYLELTDKIFRGLQVAEEHFDFKILLKVDTDTYVNIPKYIEYLNPFLEQGGFYSGAQGVWSPKISHNVPDELVPSERRSWYMLGGGYALSHDLVKYFAENWHLMRQWEPEDLSIGIHLQYLEIYRNVETTIYKTDNKEILCDRDYSVNHKASELQMFYLHYSSLITGEMCAYQRDETLRKKIMVRAIQAHNSLVGASE
jgi:hypothetical protein